MARKWAPVSFDNERISVRDCADAVENGAFMTYLETHGLEPDAKSRFLEQQLGRSIKASEARIIAGIKSGLLSKMRIKGKIRAEKMSDGWHYSADDLVAIMKNKLQDMNY